jgi:outer membrane protein TolC
MSDKLLKAAYCLLLCGSALLISSCSSSEAGPISSANASNGGLSNSPILSRAATGFSVSQLVFDFWRNSSLTNSARFRAKSAEETAAATRAQVILQVDRAYFTAMRAQALLKVAERTVATRQLVVEQTEALQKSGLKSGLDLAAQLLGRARESLDLAQERYRLGLSSIVELSQALLSVTVAEIENANAKFEYLIQRSALDYHRGRFRWGL